MCPADWKPGQQAIRPDSSTKYFHDNFGDTQVKAGEHKSPVGNNDQAGQSTDINFDTKTAF